MKKEVANSIVASVLVLVVAAGLSSCATTAKRIRLADDRGSASSRVRRPPKLYLMEPYDPNKEPLIMIHGLLGTPLVWAALSNGLWADDEVRARYQIWHYLYDTSAPAFVSRAPVEGAVEGGARAARP